MSASTAGPGNVRLLTTVAAVLSGSVLLAGCFGGGDDEASQAQPGVSASQPEEVEAAATATASAEAADGPYAGLTAVQILNKARKKLDSSTSVRLKMTTKDGKKKLTFDFLMNKSGRATGRMSPGGKQSMKLIRIGKTGYFQPNAVMLNEISGGDKATIKAMSGHWVKFVKGGPSEMWDNLDITDFDYVTGDLLDLTGPESGLKRVEGKKLGGRETIGLVEENVTGKMFIAADGSGEIVGYQDSEIMAVFSDWNTPVKVTAPADPLLEKDFY
ncbi:hypothetical protein KIH74_27320 [Kineosporia sp. J2-2]|uniref:Lipoprotein n=1 Tax=Kineosporia corallincola TaxID=2835133 RepID=A0ABS5TNL4_9ACTN|nr:hypothetical protein [Kineosporia corallincola]MBT0772685.1 hypothetical protein [Kineosporia corallincola]